MCSTNNSTGTLLPYGMKLTGGQSPYLTMGSQHLSLELQRAQLQDYTQRLQLGLRSYPSQITGLNPLAYHGQIGNPYLHPYFYKDPRARFIHEEPKPNHSYIGLIAMAILSVRDKKLVLSDIYQWILDNYNYFRTRGPGWRNSIRHNLSLNDCFIKAGRSANGKGHYWAIHPANIDDFQKGDFRRRRAQRRVRRHMGLSVPDDDDDDSPAPSPTPPHAHVPINWETEESTANEKADHSDQGEHHPRTDTDSSIDKSIDGDTFSSQFNSDKSTGPPLKRAKRLFDMESLLAPDTVPVPLKKVEVETADDMTCSTTNNQLVNDKKDEHFLNMSNDINNDMKLDETAKDDEDNLIKRNCQSAPQYSSQQERPIGDETVHVKYHSLDGNLISNLPHYISELQRNGDLQRRVSAFRNASQYAWPTFPGYISNYHLMALNAGAQQQPATGMVPGSVTINNESAQRWQQTMANLFVQNQLKEKAIAINDD